MPVWDMLDCKIKYTGPESVPALAELCLGSHSALVWSLLPSFVFFFPVLLLLLFSFC